MNSLLISFFAIFLKITTQFFEKFPRIIILKAHGNWHSYHLTLISVYKHWVLSSTHGQTKGFDINSFDSKNCYDDFKRTFLKKFEDAFWTKKKDVF